MKKINIINQILVDIVKSEQRLVKKGEEPPYRFWYRGESSDYGKNKLTPSLYRLIDAKNDLNSVLDKERAMINDFYMYGPSLFKNNPKDGWEWLGLMQHHRLPTRLLDWTENRLQAIFFAFHTWNIETKKFPMLYVLHPNNLNKLSIKSDAIYIADNDRLSEWLPNTLKFFDQSRNNLHRDMNHIVDRSMPISIYSRFDNERILKQSGTFVLFGEYCHSLEKCIGDERYILEKINLKKYKEKKSNLDYRNEVLNQLDILGVNEFTTYGGFDALSDYLKRIHT